MLVHVPTLVGRSVHVGMMLTLGLPVLLSVHKRTRLQLGQ